jgi:1-deoxyxylulose-5-phosphate synthase
LTTIADSIEILIAAKVHGKMREGRKGGGLSRKVILSETDKSLKRSTENSRALLRSNIGKAW